MKFKVAKKVKTDKSSEEIQRIIKQQLKSYNAIYFVEQEPQDLVNYSIESFLYPHLLKGIKSGSFKIESKSDGILLSHFICIYPIFWVIIVPLLIIGLMVGIMMKENDLVFGIILFSILVIGVNSIPIYIYQHKVMARIMKQLK